MCRVSEERLVAVFIHQACNIGFLALFAARVIHGVGHWKTVREGLVDDDVASQWSACTCPSEQVSSLQKKMSATVWYGMVDVM